MELGLDVLHREIGALHEPEAHGCATARDSRHGPLAQLLRHRVRVREVRLEDEPRDQSPQFGLVEHGAEHGRRQCKVAVLLHVEVHELRWSRPPRLEQQRTDCIGELDHCLVERQHVEMGADRRQLHGHRVDVGSAQSFEDELTTMVRLRIAQDRLAEHIHDRPPSRCPADRHVTCELGVPGGDHHTGAL